jgi:hypothetical protein
MFAMNTDTTRSARISRRVDVFIPNVNRSPRAQHRKRDPRPSSMLFADVGGEREAEVSQQHGSSTTDAANLTSPH